VNGSRESIHAVHEIWKSWMAWKIIHVNTPVNGFTWKSLRLFTAFHGLSRPVCSCESIHLWIGSPCVYALSSVRFEGFYQICFLIDSAFGKWQYFIFSLPLSLCKLMVLGPCNLCSKWSPDFDYINKRFGCKIFYSLCDWRCDVTTNCLTMRWRPLVANLTWEPL
jgi:hypothetical protein